MRRAIVAIELLCRKIGMSQVFTEAGACVAVGIVLVTLPMEDTAARE